MQKLLLISGDWPFMKKRPKTWRHGSLSASTGKKTDQGEECSCMIQKSRAIVLAGNQNYTAQLSTTIKSIFYHNKDVKIYVLNRDILPDWFRKPRRMAQLLGGDLD